MLQVSDVFGTDVCAAGNVDDVAASYGGDGVGVVRQLVAAGCDRLGIALIEDCAHCFFGNAGDPPVGCWGDFATASLSKFFPVPEAGVLASVNREITSCLLESRSFLEQVKGYKVRMLCVCTSC